MFDEDRLRQFLDTGRRLVSSSAVPEVLQQILAAAVDTTPGTDLAGVLQWESRNKVLSPATTGQVVNDLDAVQARTGEGPCAEAIVHRHPDIVAVDDMEHELDRWPRFARAALDHGVHSSLSFLMFRERGQAASLNLFSYKRHAYGESERILGALFASQAGIALYGAQHAEQLTDALSTRDVIGQAKGMLRERFGIDDHTAFQRLVAASQHANMKLVDVARWIVNGETTSVGLTDDAR